MKMNFIKTLDVIESIAFIICTIQLWKGETSSAIWLLLLMIYLVMKKREYGDKVERESCDFIERWLE